MSGQWRDSGGTVAGQWRDSGGTAGGTGVVHAEGHRRRTAGCPAGRREGHQECPAGRGRDTGRDTRGVRSEAGLNPQNCRLALSCLCTLLSFDSASDEDAWAAWDAWAASGTKLHLLSLWRWGGSLHLLPHGLLCARRACEHCQQDPFGLLLAAGPFVLPAVVVVGIAPATSQLCG